MPSIDLVVNSAIQLTTRVRQVSAMFDAPVSDKLSVSWKIDVPYDAEPWNMGLIVGPSGSGKSTLARHLFGDAPALEWGRPSVVDDFSQRLSVEQIVGACSSVGFNTIPAWMRPHAVLSTGEKFRVEIARRLLEQPDPIVVDEFTSVVDRQVAQVGSHAVQRYVRRNGRKFVAVGCHYDVIEWLQPDWVLDMATRQFTRRRLQRRPAVECVVGRLPYAAWSLFAPYHYLSGSLSRSARCYGLWANGRLAAFAGVMYRPHPRVRDVYGVSRLVTVPDWQGLGLAFVLVDVLGAAHSALRRRLHTYPAHPALIRSFDNSPKWRLEQRPRLRNNVNITSTDAHIGGAFGGRPNAVFAYSGDAMTLADAQALLG